MKQHLPLCCTLSQASIRAPTWTGWLLPHERSVAIACFNAGQVSCLNFLFSRPLRHPSTATPWHCPISTPFLPALPKESSESLPLPSAHLLSLQSFSPISPEMILQNATRVLPSGNYINELSLNSYFLLFNSLFLLPSMTPLPALSLINSTGPQQFPKTLGHRVSLLLPDKRVTPCILST